MKKSGIIVLEGASTAERSRSVGSSSSSSSMDCLFAAPGGLLFAVYFTPGEPGVFTSCSGQDILAATPNVFRGAMETGVFSFSGNIGLEICWLEQAWAAIVESVKTTGLVVMLGVGSLLFYKLYRMQKVNIGVGIRAFLYESFPLTFELGPIDEDEEDIDDVEQLEEEDIFDLFEIDLSVGLNCLSCEHRPKRKRGRGVYIADQIRTRWRHVPSSKSSSSKRSSSSGGNRQFGGRSTSLRRHYSTPEQLVRLGQHKSAQDESHLIHLSEETSDESSLESSPNHPCRFRSHSLNFREPYFQVGSLGNSRWNSSVDSFTSGMDVSEVSRLIRDCSIDSDASDFSLDVTLNEGCGWSTLKVIERIEAEINSVKNNCFEMNQEIFTLHDVKDVTHPETSIDTSGSWMDLDKLDAKQTSFKGLLNLTLIQTDTTSDESIASLSPFQPLPGMNNEENASLEWDNEDLLVPISTKVEEMEGLTIPLCRTPVALSPSAVSMLEVQNNPIWCSQESGYLEWEGTPSDSIPTPLPDKRERDSMSCTTSFSSFLTTPDDFSTVSISTAASPGWSDSDVRRRQWAESSHENRDSAIYDQGIDLDAAAREESVGVTIQLRNFAQDTWQAPTPRAHAIKQAYAELELRTGCRRMRGIRGDQYGILRASLCQMVLKRLTLPSSHQSVERIVTELQRGSNWIHQWSFGHRLPYGPDSVVQGIYECFSTLDVVMAELSTETDAFESLVSRLNADVLLDTKLMEAMKLHVLSAALSLELADNLGDALPLFALALFSRPDSKNVKSLALNYLNPIGDSTTLERAEYYLLGYALGVRLDVYRPTAISLDKEDNLDLLTSYPDWESFTDFISIIEEDDRHFSIPVP